MKVPIRLVCGTRGSLEHFNTCQPLGLSFDIAVKGLLNRQTFPEDPSQHIDIQLRLFENNTRGLPSIYNEAIGDAKDDPAILMFIHDDVWLIDIFWPERIYEAIKVFDVVGVAGTTRRHIRSGPNEPSQVTWCFRPDGIFDFPYLSGAIGHGEGLSSYEVMIYGPSCQECKLLDGLILIADSSTLIKHGVRFDERFTFNFYDLDFCRQAELNGLTIGTWPISVIHGGGSGGQSGYFGSPAWNSSVTAYLDKYDGS